MPQLTPELAQTLQARIRYYRDLGVYDFYRRAEPASGSTIELEAVAVTNSEPSATTPGAPSFAPAVGANGGISQPIPTSIPDPEPPIPARKATVSLSAAADTAHSSDRPAALQAIRDDIGDCTRCPLAFQGRHTIVFGDGSPEARLMFIGEGPGADEDAQGLPFVGRAGQLLNNMIAAMGLQRSEVYIANIVKCRPPQNRVPEPEEANTCTQFLFRQIEVIRPQVIVALGATAATYLLGGKSPLARLRGRIHEARGAKLIVTYHPAYLLRDPTQKKEAWKDLQIAMSELGLKKSGRE